MSKNIIERYYVYVPHTDKIRKYAHLNGKLDIYCKANCEWEQTFTQKEIKYFHLEDLEYREAKND